MPTVTGDGVQFTIDVTLDEDEVRSLISEALEDIDINTVNFSPMTVFLQDSKVVISVLVDLYAPRA